MNRLSENWTLWSQQPSQEEGHKIPRPIPLKSGDQLHQTAESMVIKGQMILRHSPSSDVKEELAILDPHAIICF